MKKLISFIIRVVPRPLMQKVAHIASRIISIFYLGKKVHCSVCDHQYRKFLPYGVKGRSNALCPNCLSLERHRLMWMFLKDQTDFFKSSLKVLHIAPEHCFINRFEEIHGENYITADLESPLAKVKMDVHDIPFDDHSFDVVFCNHVMEHVDDDIKAMSEMHRVLKPDGFAIIQSPINEDRETTYEDASITSPAEREKHFGQYDHVREFGLDYGDRLKKAGFSVTKSDYVNKFSHEELLKFGIYIGDRKRITIEEMIFYLEK